jgi:FkbM family methyltransferase
MTRSTSPARRLAHAARRRLRPTSPERRIAELGLGPDDLAIDCGANVGDVTVELARTGALVHAFEPNPDAFAVLAERVDGAGNVHVHRQAVLDRAGTARLYLHEDAARDPIGASVGSSVLPYKANVVTDRFVEVEAVDLASFVLELRRPVKVLKLDVEGAECPIVHRLLDTGAMALVCTALVELHDRHIPELKAENDRLRERIAREGLAERVLTDWE